ncbi:PREDICTED: uncharacterized protein LOC109326035 [Lupinus angustifolius]|uniref:uncharacterized protein LOC109326035 n=1 Tax=Lupinus angustifolius TaxID=3871 RepID=UPI00092E52A0|nr:PREDICTED: uncharacterized protein LOC109326035 [Lupinus angustifolius]
MAGVAYKYFRELMDVGDKIEMLTKAGKLSVGEEDGNGTKKNMLSRKKENAMNQGANADNVDKLLVRRVCDLRMSMQHIFDDLRRTGYNVVAPPTNVYDERCRDPESHCDYLYGQAGHSIEDCWGYKARVQVVLNLGVIQARKAKSDGEEVDMVKKVTLRVLLLNESSHERVTLRVRKPQSFTYENTHTVPWSYWVKVDATWEVLEVQVSKMVMTGEITRSGRSYGPPDGETRKVGKKVGGKDDMTEEVIERKEEEFLKIMRQSEYDMVEQLGKTPSKISLLSLVLSSNLYRKALLRVLNEAYVNPDVTPSKMVNMVDHVKHVNMITFFDEETVRRSEKIPRTLLITAKCRGHIVSKILIDGWSALNILPLSTLLSMAVSSDEIVLRSWIHEAGAVPSTLHQAVKFINDEMVITVHREEEVLVLKPISVPYVESTKDGDDFLHSVEVCGTQQREGKGHVLTTSGTLRASVGTENPAVAGLQSGKVNDASRTAYFGGRCRTEPLLIQSSSKS